jgi:hypothetical protein
MTDTSWLGPAVDVRPVLAEQQTLFLELLHPRDGEAFSVFLDRINEEWVTAARRISPGMLIELLASFGDQIVELWQTVDLDALDGPVRWAGPEAHPFWLDVAREYTEYWCHQQQICDATGRPGLSDPRYLHPVIDAFLRALPHTLRDVAAPEGSALRVTVTGPAGGTWTCARGVDRWRMERSEVQATAELVLDADTTWRLCTRGITPEQAAERAQVSGDRRLGEAALQIVSIIWTPS